MPAAEDRVDDRNDRRNPKEHNILVARRHNAGQQFFTIPCKPEEGTAGSPSERAKYGTAVEHIPSDPGYRSMIGFACAETQEQADGKAIVPRGPALATIPLHPDPTASASCTCYLINPENVSYETSWTAEEWTDQQIQESDNVIETNDAFEVLVASPGGKVYLVSKTANEKKPKCSAPLALELEPELWSSLRNGTVAGSVRLMSGPKGPAVLPVVNVQALMPSKLRAPKK